VVVKKGSGIQIYYERKDQMIPPRDHAIRFRAMFPERISVVFGTGAPASNMEISTRLRNITASWFGDQYGPSWRVNLSARPQTSELGNEIYAEVLLTSDKSWNGICRIPGPSSCASPLSTTIRAAKEEEATIMIQYAWLANWTVKGTIALREGL
jgi:hypothetical protein